jgi:ketosteroid isomerase-like protein
MNPNDNKRAVQAAFEALSQGDTQPYLDLLSEDISWTVIGTTKWSGTYRGKADLMARLLRPVNALLVPKYKAHIQSLVAEGARLVIELRGENTTTSGKPYNNRYCWVCRMSEGKLVEVTEYADTALIAAALTG